METNSSVLSTAQHVPQDSSDSTNKVMCLPLLSVSLKVTHAHTFNYLISQTFPTISGAS